jgi:hypothetical protein
MLNTNDNKSETFDASNNVFVMTINRHPNALTLVYRILLRLDIFALSMQRILCVQRSCFLNGLSAPNSMVTLEHPQFPFEVLKGILLVEVYFRLNSLFEMLER